MFKHHYYIVIFFVHTDTQMHTYIYNYSQGLFRENFRSDLRNFFKGNFEISPHLIISEAPKIVYLIWFDQETMDTQGKG